jgi:hypothetical protein
VKKSAFLEGSKNGPKNYFANLAVDGFSSFCEYLCNVNSLFGKCKTPLYIMWVLSFGT